MDTPDELRAEAYAEAQESAAIRRGEPAGTYVWSEVKPYPKRPRLNPTLVLDNTPQELADKLAGPDLSNLHPVMADALRPFLMSPRGTSEGAAL